MNFNVYVIFVSDTKDVKTHFLIGSGNIYDVGQKKRKKIVGQKVKNMGKKGIYGKNGKNCARWKTAIYCSELMRAFVTTPPPPFLFSP